MTPPSIGAKEFPLIRDQNEKLTILLHKGSVHDPLNRVTINREIMGGQPCVKGTRITVSQLIAEISDGQSVHTVANDFSMSLHSCEQALEWAAWFLDRFIK